MDRSLSSFTSPLRYLLAKRKQAFISVISFFSTLGVTVGVMAVDHRAGAHDRAPAGAARPHPGFNPHVYVWKPAASPTTTPRPTSFVSFPHVIGAAPAILGQGLLSAAQETVPIQDQGHRSRARTASDRPQGSAMRAADLDGVERRPTRRRTASFWVRIWRPS